MWALGVIGVCVVLFATSIELRVRYLDWKDRNKPDKKRVWSESIWGPRGHFTIFQENEDRVHEDVERVWLIEGTLTDDPMTHYSDIETTREKAVELAKVLAGIAPFGPEEILPTHPIPNRRAAIAHTRAMS